MSDVWEALEDFAGWLGAERQRTGFVWVGTCEADTRAAGGPVLVWGRDNEGGLWVRELGHPEEWEALDEATWIGRFPHAPVPARLPDSEIRNPESEC